MTVEDSNTEGNEADILSFDELETLLEELKDVESNEETRFMKEFEPFFDDIGSKYFSAKEVLFLGGGHYGSGPCGGKNGFPPKNVWPALETLVPVLDTIRGELGHAIKLTSIYRSEVYNSCINGAVSSQHRRMTAADCVVNSVSPKELHAAAMRVRDRGGFKGGIGLYSGFVHIDVRGVNRSWKG